MSFLKLGRVELFNVRPYTPWLARHVPWSPTAWRMFGSSPSPVEVLVRRSRTRQSPSRGKAHALAPGSGLRSYASPRSHVGQKTAVRIRLKSLWHEAKCAQGVVKHDDEGGNGAEPWVDCWKVWQARTVAQYKGHNSPSHQVTCTPALPDAREANLKGDSKLALAVFACVEGNWDSVHRRLLSERSQYPQELLEFEEEDGTDPWAECWKVWLARVDVRCKSLGASEAKSKAEVKSTFAASACVKADWDSVHRRLLSEKSQYPLELEVEEEDGTDPWAECWKVWLARVDLRCKSLGAIEAKSKAVVKPTFAASACVKADWDSVHRSLLSEEAHMLLSEKAQYPDEDGVEP